ncbi:hypothetical protein DPMN_166637 [Dreissena polymorpha]|uniref:Uncharacterized protein n=1 Tax=Dreissena polymorpha TaxID=45954 RepID=A0A9D4IY25_DREPO|nr:hypothetical protein DPMN_166637 [Dreissena polymorpha]
MTPTEQGDGSADESPLHPSPEELVFPDSWCTPPAAGRKTDKTVPTKERTQPTSEERRSKIAWPAMNNSGWSSFDEDLDQVLQTALTGSVDRKLKALPSITYALGKERFGLEQKANLSRPPQVTNRRLCEIKSSEQNCDP